jgi:hypothetical protein
MIRPPFSAPSQPSQARALSCAYRRVSRLAAGFGLVAMALAAVHAQVITIDTKSGRATSANGTVDRRFAQIQPTNVPLPKGELDAKTRQELVRFLEAEQGFAMRPLPMGHKGLTLEANGLLKPAGEAYLDMVTENGLSAKPGDRVVLTDIKVEHDRITFELNGGPDLKHRFLRHVQLGAGGVSPVPQDDGEKATGARLTLEFKGHVPELTGAQVEALLAPLVSFGVKTPIQAFTDTLPPQLKAAILDHRVLVGMSTDMVLFAMGQPQRKVRETHDQMPFEEWIYGAPPDPVQFVRINGNRVIRVEVAKVGEAPEIFTKDEVEGLMRTDGTPVIAANQNVRTVQMGDVQRNPDTQAPAPPPTLTSPGEKLPDAAQNGAGEMKPVQFPQQKPDDYPDASNLPRDHKPDSSDPLDDQDSQGTPQKKDQNQNANPQSGSQPAAPSTPTPGQGSTTPQTPSTPQQSPDTAQPQPH